MYEKSVTPHLFIRFRLSAGLFTRKQAVCHLGGVLGRLITLDSAILVWWRMAAAALLMWAFLSIKKDLNRYHIKDMLQMGGVGMLLCLHWVFFYASIKASNVSIGVVCFSLVGFFTALFEPIINKHRFSGREFLFSLLTILGIYLIFQFDARYRLGIALGVVSSALYALFAIANQRVGKHYEAKNMLLWEMVGGLIGLTCLIPLYNVFIPVGRLYPVGLDYPYRQEARPRGGLPAAIPHRPRRDQIRP